MVRNKEGKITMTPDEKKKISNKRKEYLEKNPDKHPWKRNSKFKSIPCEILKSFLDNEKINFIAEYQPLFPKRFFSIDIAFPDKKIGIEINGNQHYQRDGKLKEYYQRRHELIEKEGWKIYQFHYSAVYNNSIFLSLRDILNKNPVVEQFDYSFWISNKIKRDQEIQRKREQKIFLKEKRILEIKEKLLKSNIKFSKFGWVKEASEIIGITDQNVHKWMKKNFCSFYEEKCFKRRPVSSVE